MAVYTEVSDDELEAFVAQYDIGAVKYYKGIAEGVENSNYLLSTDCGSYILTLYEKRVERNDLPFFLGLMDHLAANKFPCPIPIHGRDGASLRDLCDRPAAIVTFLNGMWPRQINPSNCHALGEAAAKLHVAAANFTLERENNLSLSGWKNLAAETEVGANEVATELKQTVAGEVTYLEGNWPDGLPSGVIHADLFPDNVFFDGDELSGLIDFYFACNDFLAYDLAVCLNAWCFEPDTSFNITKARLMINAYRKVRSCSVAELNALPLLARGAALRFLLTRLYDWLNQVDGAMVKPKDPMEYLKKLRFHRGLEGPGAYGIS